MLLLVIDKHFITIQGGITDSTRKSLIDAFSVEVPNSWFAKAQMKKKGQESRARAWDGKKKFIYKNGRCVPTGLLQELLDFLVLHNISYAIQDNRIFLPYNPEDVEINGITFRPYQQQAVDIMAKSGYGILHAGVGSGKTEIAAGLIKKLNTPKTLFLTHRHLLSSQTIKRLETRLDVPIGVIKGDLCDIKQITIGMVPTLANRIKDDDTMFIEYLQSVELVIGDEIHLGTADSWESIFKIIKTPNVFGMSGTPFKNSVIDDKKLLAIIGPEIFKVPTSWLIKQGYLTPPIIKIVPIKHKSEKGSYAEEYKRCVVENQERHMLIKEIVEIDKTKQTLILVNQIDHGKALLEYLEPFGAKLIHSKKKDEYIETTVDEFATKKLNLLIATPLLDVGVDIPVLDKLILCGGSGKAITAILQRIGRSLRIYDGKVVSEVYDVVDMDDSYLYDHFKERLDIYTSEDQQFKVEVCDLGKYLGTS